MTDEKIQEHIETNCRDKHGQMMMDEQAFYEGAKWARDQMNSSGDIQPVINLLVCELCEEPLEKVMGKVCENTMCDRHR